MSCLLYRSFQLSSSITRRQPWFWVWID